jgi:hypothetical protein
MYEKCAKSLAEHATKVIESMTGHIPDLKEIQAITQDSPLDFILGQRVNFSGRDGEGGQIYGFFICAFDEIGEASALAGDIARSLELTPPGRNRAELGSFVGELLNVIIGLACAAWDEHGLEVKFSPPEKLREHHVAPLLSGASAWEVRLSVEGRYEPIFLLVFNSAPDRPPEE